jgi:hypothetical protein
MRMMTHQGLASHIPEPSTNTRVIRIIRSTVCDDLGLPDSTVDAMVAFVGKDSPKANIRLASGICANSTLLNKMILRNEVLLKLLQPTEKLGKSLSRLVTPNQTLSIKSNSSNHMHKQAESQIKIKSTTGCEENPKC